MMKVGDVVVPRPNACDAYRPILENCTFQLACGSGWYTHAIVASLDPFILVSEEGDMLWSATIKPHYFIALCQADKAIRKVALKRWKRDQNAQPKEPTR